MLTVLKVNNRFLTETGVNTFPHCIEIEVKYPPFYSPNCVAQFRVLCMCRYKVLVIRKAVENISRVCAC